MVFIVSFIEPEGENMSIDIDRIMTRDSELTKSEWSGVASVNSPARFCCMSSLIYMEGKRVNSVCHTHTHTQISTSTVE